MQHLVPLADVDRRVLVPVVAPVHGGPSEFSMSLSELDQGLRALSRSHSRRAPTASSTARPRRPPGPHARHGHLGDALLRGGQGAWGRPRTIS